MKKLIIWILALALLALIGAIVFRFTAFTQIISSAQQEQIGKISKSNKIKDTIRVAGDNYFGYWFLTSKEFKIRLGQKGYALAWTNDGGNYE
jgi:hypothetical protein